MHKLFIAMLVTVTICLAGQGAKAEVPYLIPVVGVLTDADDVPLEGNYQVVFNLYSAQIGGVTLGGETQDVEFDDGLFRAYLGSETTGGLNITPFIDNQDVWLGIRVGADGEMNRVRLASVPWAFEAETCAQVTDLSAAGIQSAIGADACGANQAMRGWTGSAAVCVELPSTAGLVANTDIGVTVQAPIDQTLLPCNYGIQQISTAGAVVCVNQDVVTQCGEGAGEGSADNYLGSDGACHKAPHSCTANQYLDGDGTCQEAPHKCTAGQYLDGAGSCVALAVVGTANRLAMFTNGTTVGDSIVTQSGTTGISVAGDLAATGQVTAESLVVTNGLPIVIEPRITHSESNGTPPSTTQLGAANGRRMCFLMEYNLHDTMADESRGHCRVYSDGNNWILGMNVDDGGGDPDLDCAAQCITW